MSIILFWNLGVSFLFDAVMPHQRVKRIKHRIKLRRSLVHMGVTVIMEIRPLKDLINIQVLKQDSTIIHMDKAISISTKVGSILKEVIAVTINGGRTEGDTVIRFYIKELPLFSSF